jgi:hypothetical protein
VLISLRHLVLRLRHPRSRADELATLAARFAVQPSAREASDEERAVARRMRVLRRELSDAIGAVSACSRCARGHPLPNGRWDGGHCCGGGTFRVFTPDEVASLKIAGTRVNDLDPPQGDHAGCVFRGPEGCSLEPEDRPSICVRYVCPELREELRTSEDELRWRRVGELARELQRCIDRFAALRQAARDDVLPPEIWSS